MSKLFEKLAAALAELEAETRFRARTALGSPEAGLRLLAKVERSGQGDPEGYAFR